MSDAALAVEQLQHTFNRRGGNEVPALAGIDLTVERGSWVIILGANGSGKSALLNAIAGSFAADHGRVRIDGVDVTDWPAHRRASRIGRVFQDPFSGTAPRMTVAENLALALRRNGGRGLRRTLTDEGLRQLAERVASFAMGLESRLDDPIGKLSGGQRQALTLLMATLVRPALLLLDEHTSALDPRSAEKVLRLTEEIVAREELTTLMVTHSMAQAVRLGTRVIMMHRGRVVQDFSGARKERLRVDDLLAVFDQLRYADQLDESAAGMLKRLYV